METSITINTRTFQILLLESFRYCLGRKTGAVSDCVENLELYWKYLPTEWQQQIHGDILRAIAVNKAGMDMDVKEWEKILKLKTFKTTYGVGEND